MAVSLAISEICSVKEWPDLEITACTVVAKVMGKGDFQPPTAAKPLDRF